MINFLVSVFIITLIYLAKVEMVKSYFTLMGVQGLILFGLAYFELEAIDMTHLLFILVETFIFKAVFVPLFLRRITKNQIHRHHNGPIKGYYSVLITAVIINGCFIIYYAMRYKLNV